MKKSVRCRDLKKCCVYEYLRCPYFYDKQFVRKFISYLLGYINLSDVEQYELLLTELPVKFSTQRHHIVIINCNELQKDMNSNHWYLLRV